MTRQDIIDTYNRLEAEAGGYAAPGGDAKTIVSKVAQEMRLAYDTVKEVMIDEWTRAG